MEDQTRVALITDGARIRRSISKLEDKLAKIEAQLVTLPKGTYKNEKGEVCQVIDQAVGKTTYALKTDALDNARTLCGPVRFSQLFDRKVVYLPCAEFPAVAARVLPEKSADLLTLCAVAGKPGKKYVRWS